MLLAAVQGLLTIRTREVLIFSWRKLWGGKAKILHAVLNLPAPEDVDKLDRDFKEPQQKWLRAGAIYFREKIKRTNYVLLIQTRQAVDWGGRHQENHVWLFEGINIKVEDELFRLVQGGDNTGQEEGNKWGFRK